MALLSVRERREGLIEVGGRRAACRRGLRRGEFGLVETSLAVARTIAGEDAAEQARGGAAVAAAVARAVVAAARDGALSRGRSCVHLTGIVDTPAAVVASPAPSVPSRAVAGTVSSADVARGEAPPRTPAGLPDARPGLAPPDPVAYPYPSAETRSTRHRVSGPRG